MELQRSSRVFRKHWLYTGGATTFKRLFTKPSERFFYTVSYRKSRSAKGLEIYYVYQFDHPR